MKHQSVVKSVLGDVGYWMLLSHALWTAAWWKS